jgi:hypothetical protein
MSDNSVSQVNIDKDVYIPLITGGSAVSIFNNKSYSYNYRNVHNITARMTLVGDPFLVHSITINVNGVGVNYNNNWRVTGVTHKIDSSGYLIDASLERSTITAYFKERLPNYINSPKVSSSHGDPTLFKGLSLEDLLALYNKELRKGKNKIDFSLLGSILDEVDSRKNVPSTVIDGLNASYSYLSGVVDGDNEISTSKPTSTPTPKPTSTPNVKPSSIIIPPVKGVISSLAAGETGSVTDIPIYSLYTTYSLDGYSFVYNANNRVYSLSRTHISKNGRTATYHTLIKDDKLTNKYFQRFLTGDPDQPVVDRSVSSLDNLSEDGI